ncbi:efflux RND transporter periplasmic adaptor subunit [Shewanella surugensis]|uniref:Efflux RND transporter periplasmic adaptor subunit n=1 Tax=Shewanella surugensis TaxID=212020 RepID=A0ABT0LDH9_9GAMM|nr:efflux RND transporter periplasmic adaptor subunit [Shewanella surugensis]MCL1125753.1 efflux RND transporter periplasmic adaptor subunit [Shewanella surugensis]
MTNTLIRRLSPLIILALFIAVALVLNSTKTPPEEKVDEAPIPIVNVIEVQPETLSLNLSSYGVVTPKYKTQLVTEVAGRIMTVSNSFVAGGMVKKGDALASIEPSDYEADLMQAQASLAQAMAALDEEKARGEVARNDWKGYDSKVAPELGLRIPHLKKEQANVKYAKASQARAERNLERTTIRAPFDGIIKARSVDLGQYVSLGTKIGELYDTDIAEVRLPITNSEQAYLNSIDNPSTQVKLSTNLAGNTQIWNGNIIRSEGVINTDNRMIYLVAEVNDPYLRDNLHSQQAKLKYGSFVTAIITGRTVKKVVKLPRNLIHKDQVTLIDADNKVEIRNVNIIRTDLEYVYVKDSLKAGDKISTTRLNNVENGQVVKIINEGDNSKKEKIPDETPSKRLAKVDE